ncbi:MAG TPA: hypothetical protein PKD90_17620, partial [Phnomibacter sp.]|nr:hypothetical protein [Phnomibacter sp.]
MAKNDIVTFQTGSSTLDFKKILTKALSVLPWFFISLALGLVAARVYTRYKTPVFTIQSTLLIRDARLTENSDAKLMKDLGIQPTDKNIENEIDIFMSHTLLGAVVENTGVYLEVLEKGRVKTTRVYGSNSPVKIDFHYQPVEPPASVQYLLNLKEDSFYVGLAG